MSILNLLRKEVKSKRGVSIGEIFATVERRMSDNMKYAMATGKWGSKKGGSTQTGISQVLKKNVAISLMGHLRRLNHPINREGRNPKPRMLHASHWNIVCPATTPEGLPCGLVKSLACGARITTGCLPQHLAQIILCAVTVTPFPNSTWSNDLAEYVESGVPEDGRLLYDTTFTGRPHTFLLINGSPYGTVDDGPGTAAILRKLRQKRILPKDVSVSWDPVLNAVHVMCEDGGFRRPVLLPNFNYRKFNTGMVKQPKVWEWALNRGFAEYVDK